MLKFKGLFDRYARFIEEKQLLNREYWRLFVEQYRSNVDDRDLGWRCEYFGKMMRGASLTYQYTQNEELYNILTDCAEDMLTAQQENGRFSTYSEEVEFNGWDIWGRKYVLLGFLHYCEICRDEGLKNRIMLSLERHLDYIVDRIGEGNGKKPIGETSKHWLCINSCSILEPALRMYKHFGHDRYLKFAEYIIDYLYNGEPAIFKLAEENELEPYQYPVVKAYEMMSCFEGLIEYYEITGNKRYLTICERFAERVRNTEISVIGCAGCCHELFNNTVATQTDAGYQNIMQETCVTVTWMKLCDRLLSHTGDSKYADEIERSAYNALYGAVNTEDCLTSKKDSFVFDSYSPLFLRSRGRGAGGYKDIAEGVYFGCCVAIGAHATAMMPLYAVKPNDSGITIDFYEKGKVEFDGFGVEIETNYPADGNVKITVVSTQKVEKTVKLRVPYYSENTALSVCGESVSVEGRGYVNICRKWRNGDVIELMLDMNPRVLHPVGMEEKPETKNFLAVMYGPLTLARDSRVDSVECPVPEVDEVKIEFCDKNGFNCEIMADVTLGNKTFKMIDYMSAGKIWHETSCEAWLPTK